MFPTYEEWHAEIQEETKEILIATVQFRESPRHKDLRDEIAAGARIMSAVIG